MQIDHLGFLRFDYFFMHVIKMVVMIDWLDIWDLARLNFLILLSFAILFRSRFVDFEFVLNFFLF